MAVSRKRNKNSKPELKRKKHWFQLKHIKNNHPTVEYENEYYTGKKWCLNQDMEEFYIRSRDNLRLHAYYLPARKPKRTLILCHGYKGSGFGDFAYISSFLHDNNCNLLFIDERCCGKSDGHYITFGAKEKEDIALWAKFVNKKISSTLPLYLYGESMGAASVLMATGLSLPSNTKGIISDCGFTDMKNQFRTMAADWFHLKRINIILFNLDILCRALAHFKMNDANTKKALKTNGLPILFFHGMKDTYVSYKNSIKNYEMCKAKKELVLIPKARHLCCAYADKELYRNKLLAFFKKYD
ncbi:MAG: alpha/beta hydrolase [Lachnospiraceae bacterium]|nr:alpha/beta hydrolase [Lachnospiraceae bacterium]